MATAQEVIKNFMKALDDTTLSGADALDEAIVACSNGRYADMQSLIDEFITNFMEVKSDKVAYLEFLRNYCGVVLRNKDTGSIIGSDAGGGSDYTAESIVNEVGDTVKYPSASSSTINGVTIHWPERSTLTAAQQTVVARLYT